MSSPRPSLPISVTPETTQRIMDKIIVSGDGCWEWQGTTVPSWGNGYGRISVSGRLIYTHRYMATKKYGPIPDGMHTDHLCRNTLCCNPDHLEVVTPRENAVVRAVGRYNPAERTHCSKGHPIEHVKIGRLRTRCRTCIRAYKREWVRKKRAEQRASE